MALPCTAARLRVAYAPPSTAWSRTHLLPLVGPTPATLTARRRPALPPRPPSRPVSFKFLDNLIPEDDPATKEAKERESRIIRGKLQRSKFAELAEARKDKAGGATTAAVTPPSASPAFPTLAACEALLGGAPVPLPAAFACAPVTVVTVAFQALGQAHVAAWHAGLGMRQQQQQQHGQEGGDGTPAPLPRLAAGLGGGAGGVALLNLLVLEGWFWRAVAPVIRRSSAAALGAAGVAPHSALLFETSEKAMDVSGGGGRGGGGGRRAPHRGVSIGWLHTPVSRAGAHNACRPTPPDTSPQPTRSTRAMRWASTTA